MFPTSAILTLPIGITDQTGKKIVFGQVSRKNIF